MPDPNKNYFLEILKNLALPTVGGVAAVTVAGVKKTIMTIRRDLMRWTPQNVGEIFSGDFSLLNIPGICVVSGVFLALGRIFKYYIEKAERPEGYQAINTDGSERSTKRRFPLKADLPLSYFHILVVFALFTYLNQYLRTVGEEDDTAEGMSHVIPSIIALFVYVVGDAWLNNNRLMPWQTMVEIFSQMLSFNNLEDMMELLGLKNSQSSKKDEVAGFLLPTTMVFAGTLTGGLLARGATSFYSRFFGGGNDSSKQAKAKAEAEPEENSDHKPLP